MTDRHVALQEAIDALPDEVREELARRWTEAALDEHASIASFSRFSLQLMAAGAPPELLEGAHQAALDEVRHAKLCFELAARYSGEELSPGPLPLEGDVLGATDLASLAVAAVGEGCVGETVAALEARHAADAAEHHAVRNALRVIARDEERHAALAWQFVAWAVKTGGSEVKQAVRAAFDAYLTHPVAPEPAELSTDHLLAAHGKLGRAARHRAHREAFEEVLAPTAAALLA